MSLRSAYLNSDGELRDPQVIDMRVCDCCQTAGLSTPAGAMVAYRDRSPEEVRDISISLFDGREWSEPFPLHEDGWNIHGCPVNGAAFDGSGNQVAAAWYTEPSDQPGVFLAFSTDGARTFADPIGIDEGSPIGRVDVLQLEDGSALVMWVEKGEPNATILLRKVSPEGPRSTALAVSNTSSARASGFPRMVRTGEQVVFAWTEVGEPTRIRLAVAGLSL